MHSLLISIFDEFGFRQSVGVGHILWSRVGSEINAKRGMEKYAAKIRCVAARYAASRAQRG